jgi:DNA-binding CsgD family transcriptional regulator
MGKSNCLRLSDAEAVFQLVHECCEMWTDADAWYRHLLRGSARLTGTTVSSYFEVRLSPDARTMHVLAGLESGWRDAEARSHSHRFHRDSPNPLDMMPELGPLFRSAGRGHAIASRPELIGDGRWYASRAFVDYLRPAALDGYIMSLAPNPQTGVTTFLSVHQDQSDPAPTPRAQAMLALLHRRIAPLVGTRLTSRTQPGRHSLSPRLRQTLDGLLAGQAEKQIARHLGISPATVHEYVGDVYRHFNVSGRSELMAHFIHMHPACPGNRPSQSQS